MKKVRVRDESAIGLRRSGCIEKGVCRERCSVNCSGTLPGEKIL